MPAARSAWQIFWATRYGPVANGGRGSDSDSDLFESRSIHTAFGSNHRSTVMDQLIHTPSRGGRWNKGKLVGQKAPLRLKEIWAIQIRLQLANRIRDLALFNLAIDSKLRSCDLVKMRVRDLAHGDRLAPRAIVVQQKTQRPVQFEITEQIIREVFRKTKHIPTTPQARLILKGSCRSHANGGTRCYETSNGSMRQPSTCSRVAGPIRRASTTPQVDCAEAGEFLGTWNGREFLHPTRQFQPDTGRLMRLAPPAEFDVIDTIVLDQAAGWALIDQAMTARFAPPAGRRSWVIRAVSRRQLGFVLGTMVLIVYHLEVLAAKRPIGRRLDRVIPW